MFNFRSGCGPCLRWVWFTFYLMERKWVWWRPRSSWTFLGGGGEVMRCCWEWLLTRKSTPTWCRIDTADRESNELVGKSVTEAQEATGNGWNCSDNYVEFDYLLLLTMRRLSFFLLGLIFCIWFDGKFCERGRKKMNVFPIMEPEVGYYSDYWALSRWRKRSGESGESGIGEYILSRKKGRPPPHHLRNRLSLAD